MTASLIALHILSAVVWVGGMFFAYMVLRPAAGRLEQVERLARKLGRVARGDRPLQRGNEGRADEAADLAIEQPGELAVLEVTGRHEAQALRLFLVGAVGDRDEMADHAAHQFDQRRGRRLLPEQVGEIRLELDLAPPEAAILTVIDEGPEFDPLSVSPARIPSSLDEAQVGGLGIHLVRSFADSCEYRRDDGRNVFRAYFGAQR